MSGLRRKRRPASWAAWTARLCVFLFLVGLAAFAGEDIRAISLDETLAAVLKNNRQLKLMEAALDLSRISEESARDGRRPVLRPAAGAQSADDQTAMQAGIGFAQKTAIGTEVGLGLSAGRTELKDGARIYQDAALVELRQPLLRRFGTLVNLEAERLAGSRTRAAMRELESKKADLVLDTVERYEMLLRLQSRAERARDAVKRLDGLCRLLAVRERQGRASRLDVLRAEIQLGAARFREASLEEEARACRAGIAEQAGWDPGVAWVAGPSPRFTAELPSAESVIATCLSNRLDYAQVLQDRADRERGVAVASRGSWPDIDLVWRYQERGQDAAASGALTLDENTWFVGISAGSSWPSYGERRALQSAIIERQSADLRVAALAAVISRQAHESLSECRRVRSQLELSEKTYRLARERLVLARKLFEMGRADSFSVAEAEDELQEAEGQWLEAVSGETVAVYRLMHVMGTLLDHPPELKPPAAAR